MDRSDRSAVVSTVPSFLALWVALLALAVLSFGPVAAAQGSPSGDYGALALGGKVEGTIAGIRGQETAVFHTYTVSVPAGAGAVTVRVEGFGSDLDVALKIGSPIVDYEDVDLLDVSEDQDPVHTIAVSGPTVLYIDVLNLLPQAASYRLSAATETAAPTPPAGAAANPLAPSADPLLGMFEGDGLRVVITGGEGSYSGELVLAGQTYAFQARGGNGRIDGEFLSGSSTFPFSATLAGNVLDVESGGATYRTRRVGGVPTAPENPLGGGAGAPSPDPSDGPLAQGAYGVLTRDNAMAFVEALEFSLQQAGFVASFTDAERTQILDALALNYGTLGPSDQAVLGQAREVWTRVQANWASASPDDQREFVVGVFVLAFGEEAVQQAMAGGGAGAASAGAGGCETIDDCMSTYADPETYQDTMNSQSCWAAAGCDSYDPIDNSFSYESYDTY